MKEKMEGNKNDQDALEAWREGNADEARVNRQNRNKIATTTKKGSREYIDKAEREAQTPNRTTEPANRRFA